ncbi:MAG: site-specific DNA-methyltransferase [Candidatus Hodarchaeota archaeon]
MTFNNQPVPPPFHTVESISPVSLFREFYHLHCKSTKDRISTSDSVLSQNELICAYDHRDSWANRIIYGESLQMMDSLLHYESLGGKIQMIYFDPPFGIDFDARFHPFETVLQTSSKVRTYRDNWTGGLSSYLKYLKERLEVAKKLLHSEGSIFVQISDAHVHHVRVILDDIFGAQNFCSMITFRTGTSLQSRLLASVSDYLLWYAKDKNQCFSVPLFRERFWHEKVKTFDWIKLPDGHSRRLTSKERDGTIPPPEGSLFKVTQITRKRRSGETPRSVRFQGQEFFPPPGLSYSNYVNELVHQDRVIKVGSRLYGVRYESDFPFVRYTNLWNDTVRSTFDSRKNYPVQTNPKVIERCLLMTTRPGDIVLDPTGGSGTTAYIAEKWGRKWIVCDISRISKLITRQRLLTSSFDMYAIKKKKLGVKSGFKYEQRQDRQGREVGGLVPHLTRQILTKKSQPKLEKIVDRPTRISGIVRASGTFVIQNPFQYPKENSTCSLASSNEDPKFLREMISAFQAVSTMQMCDQSIFFQDVESLGENNFPHAIGRQDNMSSVAFAFGAKFKAIAPSDIQLIIQSVSSNEYERLYLVGFDFSPEALSFLGKMRLSQDIPIIPVCASLDLHMRSYLKLQKSSQIFNIIGIPHVQLEKKGNRLEANKCLFQIVNLGIKFIDPRSNLFLPVSSSMVAAWFLDTDYNGRNFHVCQAFFPGTTNAWKKLQNALKTHIDFQKIKKNPKTVSFPFKSPRNKRIAVKIVDFRGNEVMSVVSLED